MNPKYKHSIPGFLKFLIFPIVVILFLIIIIQNKEFNSLPNLLQNQAALSSSELSKMKESEKEFIEYFDLPISQYNTIDLKKYTEKFEELKTSNAPIPDNLDEWGIPSKEDGYFNYLINNPFVINELPDILDIKYVAHFTNLGNHPCTVFDFENQKIYIDLCYYGNTQSNLEEKIDLNYSPSFPKRNQEDVTQTLFDFLTPRSKLITEQFDFPLNMVPRYTVLVIQFSDYSILRYLAREHQYTINPTGRWEPVCDRISCETDEYEEFDFFIDDLYELGTGD